MDILKSNISLMKECTKTIIDNQELPKNLQVNKEEKVSQKVSQEKNKTKQIKRKARRSNEDKKCTAKFYNRLRRYKRIEIKSRFNARANR